MKLSILMPVYNEAQTIDMAIKRVMAVDYPCDFELIIVDDGSTDDTAERIDHIDDSRIVKAHHSHNRGKGAALRTASNRATGDYVVICDADLEYEPEDIPSLLAPILNNETEVCFGSRTFGSHTAYSFWYVLGNKAVSMFTNVLYNSWLSDIETCFKLMPLELYQDMDLRQSGFGVEAEITGKLLRRGIRPMEIPITYRARSREAGKKLTWRDGVEALWILSRVRWSRHP